MGTMPNTLFLFFLFSDMHPLQVLFLSPFSHCLFNINNLTVSVNQPILIGFSN